jgi:hypothetical protein
MIRTLSAVQEGGVLRPTAPLAKLYHPEIGTPTAEQLALDAVGSCFVSRLGMLEMRSVLAQKVRTSQILSSTLLLVLRRFRGDIRRRRFQPVPVAFDTTSLRSVSLKLTASPAACAR